MSVVNRENYILILLSAGLVMLIIVLLVVVAIYRNLHQRTITPESGPPDESLKMLSPTEKKFYKLFEKGLSTSEIADAMHVEISTVYTMKHRIKKKIQDNYLLHF